MNLELTTERHVQGEAYKETLFTAEVKTGQLELREVFNGIVIVTEDGDRFGIAQRDRGLEIVTPRGLVGVKLDTYGKLFLEAGGKGVWGEL